MPTTQASSRKVDALDEPAPPIAEARRSPRSWWIVGALVAIVAALLVAAVAYRVGVNAAPPPTTLTAGPVELGFAQDMLDHHDQAIQFATYAQAHAESPMVRAMAAAVISSQRYEIGLLEKFLEDRGAARGDRTRMAMAWMNMPVPLDRMPGLQPDATVVDYLNLQGPALDKRFLELMIEHHQGGVHMAEYAGDHAEGESIRALARRMVVDQRTEIGDYQSALQGL